MFLSATSSLVSDIYQILLRDSLQAFYVLSVFNYYPGKEQSL